MRIAITLLLAASAAQAAVTGTIVNEEGKPIAGATVQSFASEDSRALRARLLSKSPDRPPSATVQSAENGSFSVTPKTALTDIAIAVGGRQVIGLQLPDGEDAGTIVVPSHASRRVRVLGDGKALPNVLVAAGPFTTRTDAAGMADLIETSIGVTRTGVIHPGYVIQEESIAESQTPTEIKLVKGMSVRGKVAGADGAPVEHAIVSIDGWPLAETDSSGDFTLAHAPSQWRSVMAIAGNRAGLAMNKPGQPVEIRLAPAATISGVIRDTSNGRGVAAALVNIHSERAIESVLSDEKGAFALTAALAGRYTVSGSHPAFQIPPTDIATQSKSIEARPLTRIRGRVIDEKRDPVGGAYLWYGIRGTPPAGHTVISAPDGTFTLRAFVQQFPQPVMAYKAGYAAGTSGPVSTDSAKSALNITLPRGFPLVVKIVDKQRQPIAGANVFVMAGNPTDAVTRYPALCERVSADCHFTDTSGSVTYRIVEGKYQLMIRGDAVANKMVPTDNLTARSSPLTIEVDHGVEVSGRVTYHDGTPVTEAMMVMPRNTFSTSAHTNPDGTFTLRGLPAGPITLITRSPDTPMAQAGSADVTAPAQNVIITIPTPSRIEGRVTDKVTRQPITDFSAAVASQITRFGGAVTTPQFHSEDGTFVLDRVPAGPINLLVSAPGYAAANLGDLTAEEGKPITGVEVQLDRGGKITG